VIDVEVIRIDRFTADATQSLVPLQQNAPINVLDELTLL
jgi:hypothetical protein